MPVCAFSISSDEINLKGQNNAYTWESLSLEEKQLFSSLLHYSDQFKIRDPKFLNSQNYTIESVFLDNLNEFTTQNGYVCDFPARAKFFSELLKIDYPKLSSCNELNEYLGAVPNDKISVIYASENLLSPSSFMGHSFLKFSDKDDTKAFAISFFTDVDTYNLPKLFVEALVTGKEGIFIVSPYSESLKFYNQTENRELYEYEVNLDNRQKELISLHLWELKDKEIDYLFHTHNCATLSLDILSIADHQLLSNSTEWISPLDVVKKTSHAELISSSIIRPSTNWELKVYGQEVDEEVKKIILTLLKNAQADLMLFTEQTDESFILLEYTKAVNEKLYQSDVINETAYLENDRVLSQYDNDFYDFVIDLTDFNKMENRPDESHLSIGFRYNDNDNHDYILSWMPVSHTLSDDNRNALSESALEIMRFTGVANKDTAYLEKLTFYKIATYIPYTPILKSYSGRFELAFDAKKRLHSRNHDYLTIDGQIGYSANLPSNAIGYATVGPKVSFNDTRFIASPSFETGAVGYIGPSKWHLNYAFNWNEFGKEKLNQTLDLSISAFLNSNHIITLQGQNHNHDFKRDHQEITIQYHYLY